MTKVSRFCAVALCIAAAPLARAAVVCTPAAVPAMVRAEGLAERVGDIVLSCTGSPGEQLKTSLSVFLSVNVTNRLSVNNTLDAVISADGLPTLGAAAVPSGANGVAFTNVSATVPASGALTLRISNLRAAVANQGVSNSTPVTAFLAVSGTADFQLTASRVTVGFPLRGLLSGASAASVDCYGSPAPSTVAFSALRAAGTRWFTTRVTEGFAAAFEKASPGAGGTRVLVRYQNMPEGTRLFVPTVIAGSNAVRQTSAGDLGVAAAGGEHAPVAAGSLLLSLVPDADANGAGGAPAFLPAAPGGPAVTFDAARELTISGGSALAVYEVVDSSAAAVESAHIPTFFAFPRVSGGLVTGAKQAVMLGPVSTVASISETAPIPRFAEAAPEPDCTALGDCSVFPKLDLLAPKPFTFTAVAGGKRQSEFASVANAGGGYLAWNATLTYRNGAGWVNLYMEPNRGITPGWFRVDIDPAQLAPGVYEATLTIDAGRTAGSADVPIKLSVTAAPVAAAPVIKAAVNAASFAPGPLVPGSIASVFGERISAGFVSITFDGIAAKVLATGPDQLNVIVPADLGLRPSAQVVVNAGTMSSAAFTVQLGTMNPAIFERGVLNQDYSVNAAATPAPAGSVLQVYATGLPEAANGTVFAKLGGRTITSLDYAGQAPGFAGLWQVNIRVPDDLPAGEHEVSLCGSAAASAVTTCSPAVKVAIRR